MSFRDFSALLAVLSRLNITPDQLVAHLEFLADMQDTKKEKNNEHR